jgi:hypothetical protein
VFCRPTARIQPRRRTPNILTRARSRRRSASGVVRCSTGLPAPLLYGGFHSPCESRLRLVCRERSTHSLHTSVRPRFSSEMSSHTEGAAFGASGARFNVWCCAELAGTPPGHNSSKLHRSIGVPSGRSLMASCTRPCRSSLNTHRPFVQFSCAHEPPRIGSCCGS